MCGIVGYIGQEKCLPKIVNGLEALEYRGYDSAGVAFKKDNKIRIIKETGKIANLKTKIDLNETSYMGIGHTRWATHGNPSLINSHPHQVNNVTIVHNGIIENYEELKKGLSSYDFQSETDSEVIAALISKLLSEGKDILSILNDLKKYLVGSYALGIIIAGDDKIYAIRKDSPLIIGFSNNGNFIASDVPAILNFTNQYYLLLNDEYAAIEKDKITIYNNGQIIQKEPQKFTFSITAAQKNGFDHFMLKEIYDQPQAIKNILNEYLPDKKTFLTKMQGLEKYHTIDIIGCGSAYHVGLVGQSLINKYAQGKTHANCFIASEYRYEKHYYNSNHLIIIISQSGETADSLAVLRKAKQENIATLAIVNVLGSSIAREADQVMYIKAGPEIAVATTKAYTCQMMILILIATYFGFQNNLLDETIFPEFKALEKNINAILNDSTDVQEIAKLIFTKKDVFFLGRQIDYAIAMEASLKLKEVSYIHSEAYAAGELKHGTISLIEENTPVISLITDDSIRLKTLSNIKEVCARGALSIIITNEKISDKKISQKTILIPKTNDLLSSLLIIIKCQLLAYYVAKLKKCDIDQPRNLAKSVTVE